MHLTQLNGNSIKKVSGDGNSGLDSGYFPSPYAMTKIEDEKFDKTNCIMRSIDAKRLSSSPLKQVRYSLEI